ncbi:MAG: hypothetical protein ACRD1C_13595 [Terriglobales bacterium]
MPANELGFLRSLAGQPSGRVSRDKHFRKLLTDFVPACAFHYGRDLPLTMALQTALDKSPEPARLRDGRYFLVSSAGRPHALLWIDLQSGIALGGIFFRPSNGEPTPTLTIFSRQARASAIALSQLPAAFATDLAAWRHRSGVPRLEPRYFIGGNNFKIVLDHRGNYCAAGDSGPPAACQQMSADAADIDLNATYYVAQTHHAPNATARMIFDPEQVAWFRLRERTCHGVPDALGCRARFTRERIRVIVHRPPHRH